MSYESEKNKLLDEINAKCKFNLENDSLRKVLRLIEDEDKVYITNYIENFMNEYYKDEYSYEEFIIEALEHEVRKFCLELGYNKWEISKPFKKIVADEEYISSFWELKVKGQELDIWIEEQGTIFNPKDIAIIICDIYCGKITFQKNGLVNNN